MGLLIAGVAMASVFHLPAQAAETKEQAALTLVKGIGDEAVKTLADNSLSEEQKQQRFEKFLDNSFDMKRIGRFCPRAVLARCIRRAAKRIFEGLP